MTSGAVRAHHWLLTVPCDVAFLKTVHASWFRLSPVFGSFVEPTIEDLHVDCHFCLVCIGKTYPDRGMERAALDGVGSEPLDEDGWGAEGVWVHDS